MKVRKRTIPLDQISVEQGQRLISISTHRQTFVLSAYDKEGIEQVGYYEFTFNGLFKLAPGIDKMMNDADKMP